VGVFLVDELHGHLRNVGVGAHVVVGQVGVGVAGQVRVAHGALHQRCPDAHRRAANDLGASGFGVQNTAAPNDAHPARDAHGA
nr:hypothetical protein [Tanacetum cinerariifolium]